MTIDELIYAAQYKVARHDKMEDLLFLAASYRTSILDKIKYLKKLDTDPSSDYSLYSYYFDECAEIRVKEKEDSVRLKRCLRRIPMSSIVGTLNDILEKNISFESKERLQLEDWLKDAKNQTTKEIRELENKIADIEEKIKLLEELENVQKKLNELIKEG